MNGRKGADSERAGQRQPPVPTSAKASHGQPQEGVEAETSEGLGGSTVGCTPVGHRRTMASSAIEEGTREVEGQSWVEKASKEPISPPVRRPPPPFVPHPQRTCYPQKKEGDGALHSSIILK